MQWIDKIMGLGGKDGEVIDDPVPTEKGTYYHWSGANKLPLTIKQWLAPIGTTPDIANLESMPSFTDLVNPRVDMGNEVLMSDLNSVGAVFDVTPIEADARSEEFMQELLDKVVGVIKDSIPRDAQSPWLLQITMEDTTDLSAFKNKVESYPSARAKDKPFTKHWVEVLKEHLDDVADDNNGRGLFIDHEVAGGPWFARFRSVRLYLWRWVPKKDTGETIEGVVEQLENRFSAAGIKVDRLPVSDLTTWLNRFFYPACESNKAYRELIKSFANDQLSDDEIAMQRTLAMMDDTSDDIARIALNGKRPFSDEDGNWYFDGKPMRFIGIDQPLAVKSIKVGHLSAEIAHGERRYALWDKMPPGCVWSQTIIFNTEEAIEAELDRLRSGTIGDDDRSMILREQIRVARDQIARGNSIIKSFMGIYVRDNDPKALKRKVRKVCATIDATGLKTINPDVDLLAQDSFVRALPFGFDPAHDRRPSIRRSRKWFASHLAKLIPLYGRSRGTGNPGFMFFNRGGEPYSVDPLRDRKKNAFSLILGPTGSGKSAMLNFLIAQYVAFYDAKLFIIEKGKSFYLLGQYLQNYDVSVNQVTVSPNNPVSLNPFAEASTLREIDQIFTESDADKYDFLHDKQDEPSVPEGEEQPQNKIHDDSIEDDQRDQLGEMVIAAVTMITGGEEKELEELKRHERYDIMMAILIAGKNTRERGYTLPEDIAAAFLEMSKNEAEYEPARRARLRQFSDNLQQFCSGVRGDFFNRPGEAWPDADVTIFDVGMMVSDQYSDMLGVSVISMLNHVIGIAEANQYSGRPIIVLADEGHLTTTNPMIAPVVTNMTKMARKLNLWFWLATQNLADFKDVSAKMLTNMEWWLTMATSREEVDQISRFRQLSPDQKALLLAARKEPGKYTEGAVMSDTQMALFRNVPPAIAMALAQTEGDEKVARKKLMDEHGISELEAAELIAETMRARRKMG
ncbi:conjugative transfer ATPase [Thiomicrospira aerophila]|uniref:conjugative transfer ATPase n=1 Tax=Thiomicrospira aerophila TaxID=92245 RepID=UPI00022C3DBC|nr:conjugative transfer ATPase [Thiomicrospira aerophila]